ncbi:MAG TPA: T9SS type A sorting domain-containing protein [Bacteroidia bacterium]|nr:T9SS type A sorting domain-containing protein [Bacteroidia bacterium]
MKRYLSIIGLLFLVVSVKAQTTNSAQQNSAVNVDSHKTKYVNIYPNPSAEVLVIKVNEPKTGMEFLLYNALGQEVDKVSIVDKETHYLRRNLSKGIYSFNVLNNKEVVETGKVVFE